jgi:hypothetical protein
MTYERQGGTASILVCEDGMQIWDEETANIRKAYYDSRAIGWVARPKHGHKGFVVCPITRFATRETKVDPLLFPLSSARVASRRRPT